MKVVILAGGAGTRIQEESYSKPKPLIEIGSKPIIWHIMKIFSKFGYNEFVICCGYKGYLISAYSLPLWGMKFKINNVKILEKYREIIIVEDHLKDCGFFSWVSENNFFKKIQSFSLSSEVIGKVGSQNFLMKYLKKK